MLIFQFTADDAFIVARYAWNVYESHQLVFNSGEYVSALTSPAQAIVLWVLHYLPGEPLKFYKVLCAGLVTATLVAVASIYISDQARRTGFLLLTACSPFVLMWSVGGLETPMLLIAATWTAGLCFRQICPRTFCLALALGAVGFVIRYDSVLFFSPIIALMAWRLLASKRLSAIFFLPLLVPISWLLFSSLYFGDILPTSFYVKTPSFKPLQLLKGIGYEVSLLVVSGIWLVYVGRAKSGTAKYFQAILRNQPAVASLAFALALTLFYGLSAGNKHMMFGYRLFVPYFPALVLLILRITSEMDWTFSRAQNFSIAILQVAVLFLVWQFTVNPTLLTPTPWQRYEYQQVSLKSYAQDFLPVLERNAKSIALHWRNVEAGRVRGPRIMTFAAGQLPYTMKSAYIFETLVSYRKNCTRPWQDYADYVQVLYPSHGSREEQLQGVQLNGVRIADEVVPFSGIATHFEVWYNPRPKTNVISKRISDSCLRPEGARSPSANGAEHRRG